MGVYKYIREDSDQVSEGFLGEDGEGKSGEPRRQWYIYSIGGR